MLVWLVWLIWEEWGDLGLYFRDGLLCYIGVVELSTMHAAGNWIKVWIQRATMKFILKFFIVFSPSILVTH